MIVSNALVKVGHCQVNYNAPTPPSYDRGVFAFLNEHVFGGINQMVCTVDRLHFFIE
jgi:hypothetical protein